MKNYLFGIGLLAALSGCVSIDVTRAVHIDDKEICIVDNLDVRHAFRDAYERRIQAKGYKTQIISEASACEITSTYTATYGFHWGEYLATAELNIIRHGTLIGQVRYHAPYVSPAKHGRVENKIGAMVDQLLP